MPSSSSTASAIGELAHVGVRRGPAGRSDRPFPRPSKVTTRWCRARNGTWSFQHREWEIDQGGSSSTVLDPVPVTS